MRGRYSTIASLVSIRSAGALALLAGVGGLLTVSHGLERGQAIDFAPLVVPPGRATAPSVIFAPFVARLGARAQPPSPRSTSRSDLSWPAARGRPAASVQLPVMDLPAGGDRRRQQPPQTTPRPPPAAGPSAPLEPGRSAANPGPPRAQNPSSRRETSSAATPAPAPAAAPPTRPGWGRGDTNHSHTGPPAKNAPSPPAPPPRQHTAGADSHGSAATPNPQRGADTNQGADGPQVQPHPDHPSAAAENAPAAGGSAHDDSAPQSSPHGK